ncbi:MAG: head GIN domain-containing protein [Saprospiraceae bacterium]
MKKLLFTLIVLAVSLSSIQAQNWWKNRITGEGDVVKRTLDVDDFDGFTLAVSGDVYLRQGSKTELVVKAQENIIDNIDLKMDGSHLKITYDRPVWKSKGIDIYITVPSLNKIGVSGSGDIQADEKFSNLGDLQVAVSGSGNVKFECDAKDVETRVSGSGNISIKGKGTSFSSRVSGSGNVRASDFEVADAKISVSGSGNVYVFATESLEASVSGSGDVKYKGKPRVKAKSSGSGNIAAIR